MDSVKRFIIPGLVVGLLAVAALSIFRGEERKYVTASFPRTIAIYEGSDVRVLGVPVGKVESVEPEGTSVKVKMWYDADVDVPADAKALIISPSVVGDRYVQLTPVYKKGKVLADGAVLDMDKTAAPLELDEIYSSIDELTVALGPDGANSDGALTELLTVTAENFKGQGKQFHQTVKDLGKLTGTLENNKEELFGTAAQLERFISTLAKNDQVVRDFNASMSSVSDLLAGERDELAASLENLGVALGQVKTFVADNRQLITRNVKGLNQISKTLVKRRGELDEILRVGPLALTNLGLTYNPQAGTLDTSANFGNIVDQLTGNPALLLCSTILAADPTNLGCQAVKGLLPRSGALPSAKVSDPAFAALMEVAR